jgi:hypothetical protein
LFVFFVFLVLPLPRDWSSENLDETLHLGCSSRAAEVSIFGGAGSGIEPRTSLQKSDVLATGPRLTPSQLKVNHNFN